MELNPIGKFFIEGGNFWIFKVGIPLLIVLVAILYTMHFPKVQYSSEKILKNIMYYFYTNRIMEFTKHYYNEINIKEKSREDGIMSLEWVVATAATLIAVVAGLYTIFNNADKRKRTIQSDGECIAKQTADILYIKDRVDDILLDNKDKKQTEGLKATRHV